MVFFSNVPRQDYSWKNKKEEGFLLGILKIARDSQKSNIDELIELAKKEGYEIEYVLGKYLISSFDGQVFCDYYYEVYLKVK
ncbi:hypothetical protein ACTQ4G_02560 [Streptococcus alactolyticus]|uniref:hypothetical protein n=1 Tax=Streptococcus alactolyticus TaxID=29389 RepID=UPI003F9512E3